MFTSARAIEQVTWGMRLADYPRSLNRAKIASLANGATPYTSEEAERNGIAVNVNDLTLTRLSHDARLQLYQGFFKPGDFFTMRTDLGPPSKRGERGAIVTKAINRPLKRSDKYYQTMLSKFALLVLHGIGPSHWPKDDGWCPIPLDIPDVMVPGRTLISFDNLPFFALWRSYTPFELKKLTRNEKRNPGWNMAVVDRAVKWADEQTSKLYAGSNWNEYWVPEKREERYKADSGIYASDLVQTIDCWDFYYWDDARKKEGWRRRMVFDAMGGRSAWQGAGGYGASGKMPDKNLIGTKDDFLFTSGNRVVADKLSEILHFQFADLSAVAPFRYHSVRSLGFMLYAVCHLQNRLRCAFSEAVFENMLMYLRVKSLDEAERALKIELQQRGIIDETVQFLSPAERWQPNHELIAMGLGEYKQIINDNSASYVQNQNWSRDRVEKTKFQVMAEVNAMTTLQSSAMLQAHRYQESEYREIVRRFFKKDSTDPDVREFQAACLAQGIPESMMTPSAWDITSERILGAGNKTLELAISQQLMEWRDAFSPQAQEEIKRTAVLAVTDDAAKVELLVPRGTEVTRSAHDAMESVGTIMAGGEVRWRPEHNRVEVVQVLVAELGNIVAICEMQGNMASQDKVTGMENMLEHIADLIAEIAKDPKMKPTATALAQESGKLANRIRGFRQRLKEQQQQGQNGEMQAEVMKTMAKIENDRLLAQAKAQNTRESHADRTAQRLAQGEMKMDQDQRMNAQTLAHEAQKAALDLEVKQRAAELELKAARTRTAEQKKESAKEK